jgi:hypothetical protein
LHWRVDRAAAPAHLSVLLDEKWLGDSHCDRTGAYTARWPVGLAPRPAIVADIQVVGDMALSIGSLGFR